MTPELGLIEGFFGRPWSWAERRDTVEFLAPHGFGFYLYAPKADPFLRRRWQEPHPEAELAEMAMLSEACRKAGMRFGVGLSPFELHLGPESDWEKLLHEKLRTLAAVGAEDLAILFDDMRGDVPELAERQARIVSIAAERSEASRIICCPSYYSDDPVLDRVFGQRPENYLERLGQLLDPAVEIMWTGEEVCAREISPGHLERVAEQIGRRPFLWDNYPVNDGPRMSQHLHLRSFTGRPASIGRHLSAHGINVASQPFLTRIPALSLVECYSFNENYQYLAAFERALRVALGDELAAQVQRDLLRLEDRGREGSAGLRDTYAAFDHPAAREIVAWLDGHWEISGEAVQTQ